MWQGFVELDRILRGEVTRPVKLEQGAVQLPLVGIFGSILILAAVYGFCMGMFALIRGFENGFPWPGIFQAMASMCKVPLLYLMTLLVTFPSLCVFNAIIGSQLRIVPMLKLLVASMGINIAVLASLGPIVIFFSLSTPNYPFVVMLNVVVFGISGLLGLGFLAQTLNRMSVGKSPPSRPGNELTPINPEAKSPLPGPLERDQPNFLSAHVRQVFWAWMIIFGLVGSQMGWVLRPFIGSPNQPFTFFRERHSNFFQAVWNIITSIGG